MLEPASYSFSGPLRFSLQARIKKLYVYYGAADTVAAVTCNFEELVEVEKIKIKLFC
jgi:hypothetical protein